MPPSNVAPKVAMIMILMSVLMSTTMMVENTTTLASLSVIKTQCPKKGRPPEAGPPSAVPSGVSRTRSLWPERAGLKQLVHILQLVTKRQTGVHSVVPPGARVVTI